MSPGKPTNLAASVSARLRNLAGGDKQRGQQVWWAEPAPPMVTLPSTATGMKVLDASDEGVVAATRPHRCPRHL